MTDPAATPRTILHVDLDAFFAAVEQRDNPALRGKPVLVGGSVRRGVVAAASYEARVFGVFSAMPMAEAMRRCPDAIVVNHDFGRYGEASRRFFEILGRYSPAVEGLSLDEAFLDLTGSERLLGDPVTVAGNIKADVRRELALVASVGVAPIKFVAKIASDIDKPDGLRVVTAEQVVPFLHALPLARLWGVGGVTQKVLTDLGLRTIGDVARYPLASLRARLGPSLAEHLAALAAGIDPRPVDDEAAPRSVGHRTTFDVDRTEADDLVPTLWEFADQVAVRLRGAGLRATTCTISIKYDDFREVSRRRTMPSPTSDAAVLAAIGLELLRALPIGPNKGQRARLFGLTASGLAAKDAPAQLSLDMGGVGSPTQRERGERLGETIDKVTAKFGTHLVQRAIYVDDADDDG